MNYPKKSTKTFLKALLVLTIPLILIVYSRTNSTQSYPQQIQETSASEDDTINCLAEGDQDTLASILNQPVGDEDLCLFVGCNSFF